MAGERPPQGGGILPQRILCVRLANPEAWMQFDVRIVVPQDPVARQAVDAHAQVREGDRDSALRLYREAAALPITHASGGINLAALAIALGDWQGARSHALRALQRKADDADALVNLGVASWQAGRRKEAAQATDRALAIAPGMEAAALNLARMWQLAGDLQRSRDVLAAALAHSPGAARVQRAMADACRLLGDVDAVRRHALAALAALQPQLSPQPGIDAGPEPDNPEAQRKLRLAMAESCDRLHAAGIGHHLVGGVVVGIVRQGQPFAGDKDVDIGIDFDADRDAVARAFAAGYTAIAVPNPEDARRWCMGFIHDATGVGVDLFFKQPLDGKLRICLGWPDQLYFDLPAYMVGSLHWAGRDWPVPAPMEAYLAADYGEDWRSPTREVAGHRFDKRWLDSQLSSPSLAAESRPAAVNLGLLRLLEALQRGRWPKALALCDQLQALQPLEGVAAVRRQLLDAGIE